MFSITNIIFQMRLKSKFASALAVMAGVLFGFSSCQNDRGLSPQEPQSGEKHTVTTEMFFLDEEGNLTSTLRAIDSAKGTITGDGSYFHNTSVTVTATAKTGYTLHKLYERNGKNGYTETNGVVNAKSKSLTFNITDDMYFIAVFSSQSGSERGYQNLKVANTNGNYTVPTFEGNIQYTKDITVIGEELAPLKTATGSITGWTVINPNFKAWELKTFNADWLTARVEAGNLKLTVKPHISKTEPARTVTLQIGKDGTISSAPKVWRTVKVTQNSYYEDENAPVDDIIITYGDGTVANIPANVSTTYPATGGSKDLATLDKSFNTEMFANVPVYKNGVKTSEVVKKKVTVTFGNPSKSWLIRSSATTTYKAGVNNNKTANTATVTVQFKLGSRILKSSTITATQQPRKYNVGGEIQ